MSVVQSLARTKCSGTVPAYIISTMILLQGSSPSATTSEPPRGHGMCPVWWAELAALPAIPHSDMRPKMFSSQIPEAALDWPLRDPGPHAGCHSWKPSHPCLVLPCSKAWGPKSAQVVDNYPTGCCLHLDEALFKSSASPESFVIFLGPTTCSHRATTPDGLGEGCQEHLQSVGLVFCDVSVSWWLPLLPRLLPGISTLGIGSFQGRDNRREERARVEGRRRGGWEGKKREKREERDFLHDPRILLAPDVLTPSLFPSTVHRQECSRVRSPECLWQALPSFPQSLYSSLQGLGWSMSSDLLELR